MTRWARIEELFHAALERAPAERDAFLDAACGGDEELRREVESLLAHQPEAERLMDEPAADAATQRLAVVRGMHLGPYEVEGLIGSGGMGEVYRARDTRLGRDVAVKILPLTFAHDVERLKRFELEARAVASLTHPHILTVHDVGAHEGTPYVVTELLEGETLREVLARRAPPLEQALSFAIQAAQGLAAAHRKGVVHRDVKPDNLFVTSDGLLKILDFGLAKRLTAPVDAGPSPTVPEATRDGIVLGTVAYMSPEQAQRLALDARSDIFSFGVVLYELLTGKHPFRRETPASTLGAILEAEPRAPGEIVAGLPHDLEKIVLRCLRKDPARRFQHMDDVELELEEVSAELAAQRAEAQPPAPAHRRRRWTGGAAAALALVAVSGWLWWSLSPGKPTPPSVVQLTSYVGREITPALSPDGRQVAFAWDGERHDNFDIYVQMIGAEGLPLRLTKDPASDLFPAWSPDGRQLAFRRASQTGIGLYVVPALRRAGEKSRRPGPDRQRDRLLLDARRQLAGRRRCRGDLPHPTEPRRKAPPDLGGRAPVLLPRAFPRRPAPGLDGLPENGCWLRRAPAAAIGRPRAGGAAPQTGHGVRIHHRIDLGARCTEPHLRGLARRSQIDLAVARASGGCRTPGANRTGGCSAVRAECFPSGEPPGLLA